MSSLRARVTTVAGILALVLAGACSVPTNEEPVAVEDVFDRLVQTTTTSSPTSTPEDVTRAVEVYFLRSSDDSTRLVAVERDVPVEAGAAIVLTNLFTMPPASGDDAPIAERGLSSAIPETATLLSAELSSGTSRLVVDTQGLFGPRGVQGTGLRNALAQIVCTATDLGTVAEVSFQNEGSPVSAIVGGGETADGAVDCDDYQTLR